MSRPKEKTALLNGAVTFRVKRICYGNLSEFYDRYLKDHVSFDQARFRAMINSYSCTPMEESELYIRLAAVERQIQEEYAKFELVDESQVQYAMAMKAGRQ